ncbi:hypothetical protein GCM10027037_26540 [Mucilaginibacter koreensis]
MPTGFAHGQDTIVSAEIINQLSQKKRLNLNFPASADRFYKINNYKLIWVDPAQAPKTWQGMLLVDCVLQFGLNHNDYHPQDITYTAMHQALERPRTMSLTDKARLDILFTDALLTLINHLHFGKLNPDYPASRIDRMPAGGFKAETVLADAFQSKDLMTAISNVQPKSAQYLLLQDQMRLISGQYSGDCYEIPDGLVRTLAVNMERLRWIGDDEQTSIQVNIPSFNLKFHQPDTTYEFKVITGKPDRPTPTLQSRITYFTTAPEWNVPARIFESELFPKALKDSNYIENNHYTVYNRKGDYIPVNKKNLLLIQQKPNDYMVRQAAGCENALGKLVFRFANLYNIYLHDSPVQSLFNRSERTFSHGCVRVEHAEQLAELLLQYDDQPNAIPALHRATTVYQHQNFRLNKPISIKITYLTCEVKDATVVRYKDVYGLDDRLAMALYGNSTVINAKR